MGFSGRALEVGGPVSLYYQIKQHIKRDIEGGVLGPGAPLPSERELCEIYGVSRPTVRQATQELINEGLLERRRGVGTYVARPKIPQRLGSVLGFSERMEREGRRPATRLLEKVVLPAVGLAGSVGESLRLDPQASVLRLVRLRLADGEPVLLETVHLPLGRFPGLEGVDFESESLYRTLGERYGVEVWHLSQTLEPVVLDGDEAELLGTEAGRPGAYTVLTTYDRSGEPIEHTFSLVRGDRCLYQLEMGLGESATNGGARLRQTQLEASFGAQQDEGGR